MPLRLALLGLHEAKGGRALFEDNSAVVRQRRSSQREHPSTCVLESHDALSVQILIDFMDDYVGHIEAIENVTAGSFDSL